MLFTINKSLNVVGNIKMILNFNKDILCIRSFIHQICFIYETILQYDPGSERMLLFVFPVIC